jgi:hypothetical protein
MITRSMTQKSGKPLAIPSATIRRSRQVLLPESPTQELAQNENKYVIYIFCFSLLASLLGFALFIFFL